VEVHADLSGPARQHIAPELLKQATLRHLVVREVGRLEPELVAELLKPGDVLCITGRGDPRPSPRVVSFGVNRDHQARRGHARSVFSGQCGAVLPQNSPMSAATARVTASSG